MLLQHIYILVSVMNLLLAAVLIFLERKNIAATWAWLMVLLFLPGIGFLLYLLLGQNLSKRKIYKIRDEEFSHFKQQVDDQLAAMESSRYPFHDPDMQQHRDMIAMHLRNDLALYTQDNEVEIFTDADSKFERLLASINEATDHIHLLYYIFRKDHLGKKVLNALVEKAKQGVRVRILYDDIGSAGITGRFFKPLREAGGEVAAFFPSWIPFFNFRLNYRNHRKIAVIDGKIGFIGGINIGDEYLGKDKYLGFWRDTHLMINGSAVLLLQSRFLLDWNLATTKRFEPTAAYFPFPQEQKGKTGIQIVSSGPHSEREQIRHGYLKMIHSAQKSIYLQTPYFIPDESLLTALRIAALSGVEVKIMFPSKTDNRLVSWASSSYLGDLLKAGVRIFMYDKGFLHAKTMVVDEEIATVGTANADIRSFTLNFETNAFLYDTSLAAKLSDIFQKDLRDCQEWTWDEYRNRPLPTRLMESLARLLSPLL
ncbi:cardiolipin synthase [Brevibacillus migulae]|uniref:cardiolipin synthase n=1 Tax=Brevibacillus migulae TaxID=1644114 RepID=UPI00106DD79C|nr:cardiolipin synthase [Brevibacillus migulae]